MTPRPHPANKHGMQPLCAYVSGDGYLPRGRTWASWHYGLAYSNSSLPARHPMLNCRQAELKNNKKSSAASGACDRATLTRQLPMPSLARSGTPWGPLVRYNLSKPPGFLLSTALREGPGVSVRGREGRLARAELSVFGFLVRQSSQASAMSRIHPATIASHASL